MKKIIKLCLALLMCMAIYEPLVHEVKADTVKEFTVELDKEYTEFPVTNVWVDDELTRTDIYFELKEATKIKVSAKVDKSNTGYYYSCEVDDLDENFMAGLYCYYDSEKGQFFDDEYTFYLKAGKYLIRSFGQSEYFKITTLGSANVNITGYGSGFDNAVSINLDTKYTDFSSRNGQYYKLNISEAGYYDVIYKAGEAYLWANYFDSSKGLISHDPLSTVVDSNWDWESIEDRSFLADESHRDIVYFDAGVNYITFYTEDNIASIEVSKHTKHALLESHCEGNKVYDDCTIVKDATCAHEGLEAGICAYCGAKCEYVLPKTDWHTGSYDLVGYVPNGLHKQGYTGDYVCSDCGQVVYSGEVIPALDQPVLEVSRASSTALKLKWEKIDGAAGYYVYRATSKTGKYSKIATITKGTTVTYTNKKLKSGKTYYYKVTAYNKAKKPITTTYVTAGAALAAPSSPKLTAVSPTKVKLTFGKVAGATGYIIGGSESKTGQFYWFGSTKTNSFIIDGLDPSFNIYVKVMAFKQIGSDEVAGGVSKIVSGKSAPGKPTVSLSSVSKGMTVKWKSLAEVNGYEVYRSTSKTKGFKKVGEASGTSFADTGLKGGKTYYYKVRAYYIGADGKTYYGAFSKVTGKTTKR